MRNGYAWVLAAVTAAAGVVGCAKPESLVMRPATSPEGWNGNAFFRNNIIASEEFSTGLHGPAVDVWRFYDGYGRLYTEERDTTGNGVRNLYRGYNKDGELIVQKEDTDGDGVYDKTIDYKKTRDGQAKVTDLRAPLVEKKTDSCGIPQNKTSDWEWKRKSTETVARTPKKARKTAQHPAARTLENPQAVAVTPEVSAPVSVPVSEPEISRPAESPRPAEVSRPAEKPAPARENFIRPLPMPPGGYADSANASSRVVPGPVFHHPSDDLED